MPPQAGPDPGPACRGVSARQTGACPDAWWWHSAGRRGACPTCVTSIVMGREEAEAVWHDRMANAARRPYCGGPRLLDRGASEAK